MVVLTPPPTTGLIPTAAQWQGWFDQTAAVGGSVTTVGYSTNASTSATTVLSAADISGGSVRHALAMTGAIGVPSAMQLPTVAALVAAINGVIGQSYCLRVINKGGLAAWTITAPAGWTLLGPMSIDPGTYVEFDVNLVSLSAATLQMSL